MLGKLLKYEMRATSRTFVSIYIAILFVAIINRIFRITQIDMGFTLTVIVITGLFIALGVLTLIMIIQRFNKNLLADEGYLMFTLPVSSSHLISSKLIVSLIWTIISGLVAVLTFIILVADANFFNSIREFMTPENWKQMIDSIEVQIGGSFVWFLVEVPLIGIASYMATVLTIYFSLALGQLPIFSKHRVAFSFIAYFVITTVLQWLGMIGSNLFRPIIQDLSGVGWLNITLFFGIFMSAIFFFATRFILEKHLNLE